MPKFKKSKLTTFAFFYFTNACGYRSSDKIIYPHKAFRRVKRIVNLR
jgi:hypothetical protein